ncbi:hypothetical protein [Nocardia jejuensis]|uniref:hypothetical protein n=1 Tax=Nocardia jejuensis TaxID=328049 RepID=UPI000830FF62|nr:hypothetical protein [Nocardia jejuensis]
MSNLDERIDAAVAWMRQSQLSDGHGGAGWGWVSDVPPNPQNSAEVVCALSAASRLVPRAAEVANLVKRGAVHREEHGEWAFRAPIDLSWRMRAMHCLGVANSDPIARACRETLLAEEDEDSGGWRLSGRVGPVSVTATANAIHALSFSVTDEEAAAKAVLRGTRFLVDSMLDDDPRIHPMYASAYVATTLARPEIAAIGGKRVERARMLAVDRLLAGLREDGSRIEEEHFRRGAVADTWRHLTLHLSVGAALIAAPPAVFDPAVRKALSHLLDLQETEPLQAQHGGFRTSSEGFVTSYAGTQALEAMLAARTVVNESLNPARIFDMICRDEGAHHQDAQQVLSVRGHTVVMNSLSGAIALGLGAPAGLTISALAVGFADDLGKVGSRALVVWGMLFVAFGTLAGIATRYPDYSKRKIAALVFAGYTALVLPIVSFLLA